MDGILKFMNENRKSRVHKSRGWINLYPKLTADLSLASYLYLQSSKVALWLVESCGEEQIFTMFRWSLSCFFLVISDKWRKEIGRLRKYKSVRQFAIWLATVKFAVFGLCIRTVTRGFVYGRWFGVCLRMVTRGFVYGRWIGALSTDGDSAKKNR